MINEIILYCAIGLIFFFSYSCHKPWLVSHETASSSAECSLDKPPFSFVGTGFDHVGHHLCLATRTQISVCKSPFPSASTSGVPVPCKNGSAETTIAERGRNPVAGLWGRTLGESWPSEPTSSYASIDFWCQLVASPATAASWMSVLAMVG